MRVRTEQALGRGEAQMFGVILVPIDLADCVWPDAPSRAAATCRGPGNSGACNVQP